MRDARKVAAGVLPLFGAGELELGFPFDWTHRAPDPEEAFYLHRWSYAVTLARAAVYSDDDAAVETYGTLLDDWRSRHRSPAPGPVWESYSVSERIANFVVADSLLRDVPAYRAQAAEIVADLLPIHADYLVRNLEDDPPHNHLINNARALYLYAVWASDHHLAEFAASILEREFARQIGTDGTLLEQSTHYHLLYLARFTEVFMLFQRVGRVLAPEARAKWERMFAAAELMVRPDGSVVTVGDVSPDATPEDLAGVVSLGAELFGRPRRVAKNERAVWMIGANTELEPDTIQTSSRAESLSHFGLHVIIGPDLHLTCRADPAARVRRHGQHDALAVDLWIRGERIVADPGSARFVPHPMGDWFTGPRAHSGPIVEGLPQFVRSETIRRCLPRSYVTAEAGGAVSADGSVTCWHTGYGRLPDPVRCTRTVRVEAGGAVRIEDEIDGRAEHWGEVRLPLPARLRPSVVDRTHVELYDPTGAVVATADFSAPHEISVDVEAPSEEEREGPWFSEHYGSAVGAFAVVCRWRASGRARLVTRIVVHE